MSIEISSWVEIAKEKDDDPIVGIVVDRDGELFVMITPDECVVRFDLSSLYYIAEVEPIDREIPGKILWDRIVKATDRRALWTIIITGGLLLFLGYLTK